MKHIVTAITYFHSTDMTTALFLNATDRWSTILDLRGVTKQSKQRIHDMLGWANTFLSHKQTFHFTSFSTGFGYLLSHIWSSWRPPKLLSSPQSQLKGRKGSDGWLRSIALILAVHLGKCLILTRDNGLNSNKIKQNLRMLKSLNHHIFGSWKGWLEVEALDAGFIEQMDQHCWAIPRQIFFSKTWSNNKNNSWVDWKWEYQ